LKAFCTYDNQQLSCLHFPPHWEGVNQGGVWLTPQGCCAHLSSKVTVLTREFYFMCLYDFALVPDWLSVCECVHLMKVVRVHAITSEFRMSVCVCV